MAEHKYTSLSDLIKNQPPTNRIGQIRQESEEIPLVTDMFGELYFRESSSPSSYFGELFSPPLPLPKASSDDEHAGINQDDFDVNDQNKTRINNRVKKKNLPQNNSCMYNNSVRLFPPPISTLKMSKTGEPFTYMRFDENANSFVREEIMLLPNQGVMAASRENGRLKLRFAHDQEGEEDEDEAIDAAKDDADGEKSDDWNQD